MGISFGRGVFFHDRNVLACAEVKRGVIHVWAEKITFQTIVKLWYRVFFTLPWYYHLVHFGLLIYLVSAFVQGTTSVVNPWWVVVYLVGFHFVFPRRLKQFHGAEHKVFSYIGEKSLEVIGEIKEADIVNQGCSTNIVTCFFLPFVITFSFVPMEWSVLAGGFGIAAGVFGDKYLRRYCGAVYRLSAFLQKYVTTKEPERIHLETAIRSYQMFQYYRSGK